MWLGPEKSKQIGLELLESAVAGGMMGGYCEPGFPFYYINDKMLEYLGYFSEEEFVQDIQGLVSNCMHPEDRARVDRETELQIARSGDYQVEYRMRKKDGTYIWVHDIGKKLVSEDGKPVILSVCYDITNIKQHYNHLEKILDNIKGGLCLYKVDADYNFTAVFASKGVGLLTNHTREEMQQLLSEPDRIMQIVYPDDRQAVKEASRAALAEDKVTSLSYRLEQKEGGYIWINSVFSRFIDTDGSRLLRIFYAPTSIQYELQLEALNQTTAGVYVLDEDTDELYYANPASFRIHGSEPTEVTGKKCYEVFDPSQKSCHTCWKNRPHDSDLTMYMGNRIISISPQHKQWHGRRVAIVYMHDITKEMRLQEELQKSRFMAERNEEMERALAAANQATKAKTDFLSRMSHDLRTPMNAIMGLTALTMDDAHNPEQVQHNMTQMRSISDFMLHLVNDILDMVKIENGAVELVPEPYAYQEFLTNMKIMFAAQCEQKGIRFVIKEPALNPVVFVDKTRLNQIFFNILSNAIKYTQSGGTISYTVDNLVMQDDQLSVDYIIEDTGIGMSEEFQKHMFDPFVQEDNRVTAELQGSGLGLSITKQLVEMMGGSLTITSKQGVGTKVMVHLNYKLLEQDARAVTREPVPCANVNEILAGRKVLLVEDHPMNALIARRILEKMHMLVTHAENGKRAVESFKAVPEGFFDIILMDVRMPEMDGYTATKTIRALQRSDAQTIPIIAMTANAYAADVAESKQAGMNAHLEKPIEPEKLYQALARFLQGKVVQKN